MPTDPGGFDVSGFDTGGFDGPPDSVPPPPVPTGVGGLDSEGSGFDTGGFDGPTTVPLYVATIDVSALLMLSAAQIPTPEILTFKSCLYSFLSFDATVAPLISQLEILRVSEEDRFPAVTFKVTGRTQPVILDGPVAFDEVNCEVKIRGCTPSNGTPGGYFGASVIVDRIALAVRVLFNGKANWTMAGLPVMASWVEDDSDDDDGADDGSDEVTYIQTLNIFVRHRIP